MDLEDEAEFLAKSAALQAEIDQLNEEELQVDQLLEKLVSDQLRVQDRISALQGRAPHLAVMCHDAEDLMAALAIISKSSENISGKIRQLDKAKSRVSECQQRVSDLIDVELCSEGVLAAIQEEDYEKGAGHVHRFLGMDQSLLRQTALDVSDNAGSVARSVATLQEAAAQLRALIKHQFEEALQREDQSSVERFFKIFPLLGLHDEGIAKFSAHLCNKLQETSQKNLQAALDTPPGDKRSSVIFSDAVTLLLEGVARLVEVHQPIVETYYGPGWLVGVVRPLQRQCDQQVRRLVAEFTKRRGLARLLDAVKAAPPASVSSIASSIASSVASAAGGSGPTSSAASGVGLSSSSSSSSLRPDPKAMDTLINELTLMHSRIELYFRFIRRRITNDIEVSSPSKSSKADQLQQLDGLVKGCDLSQVQLELLGYYLRAEQYFMEESVAKAVAMDALEEGQQTSSMVDDVFFLLKRCIRRAISTGSLEGVCVVLNNACSLLETTYCGVLREQLRQGYPSGYLDLTQAYNALLQQRKVLAAGSDTDAARTAFTAALNDADASTEYVAALCDSLLAEVTASLPPLSSNERGKLESCLSGLSSVTTHLKTVVELGMQQLRSSAVRPRITPWIDAFTAHRHELTEEELSAYEAGETFVQTLITHLDGFLAGFRDCLTPGNYDTLVGMLTGDITERLERVVLKSSFNRLGGLVLDKEVRSLSSYLTTTTSWSVRDKFARLNQIATVLNMEKVAEIHEYWGSHGAALTWRLTPAEVKQVMMLRVDFKIDDIKRVKL